MLQGDEEGGEGLFVDKRVKRKREREENGYNRKAVISINPNNKVMRPGEYFGARNILPEWGASPLTPRHTNRQAGQQTDRHTYRQTDRQTGPQIHTDRPTDSQSDRQSDRHTDTHTDRQSDRQTNVLSALTHATGNSR